MFKRLCGKAQNMNPSDDPSKTWQSAADQYRKEGVWLGTADGEVIGSRGGTALSGPQWDRIRDQELGSGVIGGDGSGPGGFVPDSRMKG